MVNLESDMTAIDDKTNGDNANSKRTDNTIGQTAKRSPTSYKISIVDDEEDIAFVHETVLE